MTAAGRGLETYSFCAGCQYFIRFHSKILGNLLKQSPRLFQPHDGTRNRSPRIKQAREAKE